VRESGKSSLEGQLIGFTKILEGNRESRDHSIKNCTQQGQKSKKSSMERKSMESAMIKNKKSIRNKQNLILPPEIEDALVAVLPNTIATREGNLMNPGRLGPLNITPHQIQSNSPNI
jgi:hypothetical protein